MKGVQNKKRQTEQKHKELREGAKNSEQLNVIGISSVRSRELGRRLEREAGVRPQSTLHALDRASVIAPGFNLYSAQELLIQHCS